MVRWRCCCFVARSVNTSKRDPTSEALKANGANCYDICISIDEPYASSCRVLPIHLPNHEWIIALPFGSQCLWSMTVSLHKCQAMQCHHPVAVTSLLDLSSYSVVPQYHILFHPSVVKKADQSIFTLSYQYNHQLPKVMKSMTIDDPCRNVE